ncbi:neprilysin-1-like [Amblyomma americanum]
MTPTPCPRCLVCGLVFGCAAFVAGTFAAIVYFSAIAGRATTLVSAPDDPVSLSCHTTDCVKYEALLRATLNTSVDPCHDFKAYVTSSWVADPRTLPEQHWNYAWDVKYLWMQKMAAEIRNRHSYTPLGSLVATSFDVCENRIDEKADETRRVFKQLMHNLSVPWPEMPPQNVDPFEAHLNLCVRWNMPLWFDLRLLPGRPLDGRKAIYVYPSAYAKFWRNQYLSMNSEATERQYVDNYLVYFADHGKMLNKTSAKAVNRDEVFNFTRDVVFQLAAVQKDKRPVVLELDSLARGFGQRTERVVSLMAQSFPTNDSFKPEDKIIVKGKGSIDVVRHIVADHEPTLVLSHLGWWMLQVYAPIADNHFFVQKYGTSEMANLLRPLFCETQVESSFKLIVLANHIALNFPYHVRQNINELLDNVRESAIATYERSNLPPYTKITLLRKLKEMQINMWPKAEYRSTSRLRKIYSFEYTSTRTMLDYWISERQANGRLVGSDAYFEDKRLPHGNSKDSFTYDTLLNTVTMSMLVAHSPFYYPDGDNAINYGGLGAAFAKTLLEGLESDPDFHNVTGQIAATKGSPVIGDNLTAVHGLKLGGHVILPAFRALVTVRNGSVNNGRGFSPEKLFFISYCHSQTRLSKAYDCNGVLQGVPSFVSAFNCRPGSRMNP